MANSVPANAGRNIGARMVLLLTSFLDMIDLKHFAQGVKGWHRHRMQIRRIIGTHVDLTALYHHLVPDKKHWSAEAVEDAFWTFFLKKTYGADVIDSVLGNRAVKTKSELVRHDVGDTNYKLNVGFFITHRLKLGYLWSKLRQCAENPDNVFPGWVKDENWQNVLWLYDVNMINGKPDWSLVKNGEKLKSEHEVSEFCVEKQKGKGNKRKQPSRTAPDDNVPTTDKKRKVDNKAEAQATSTAAVAEDDTKTVSHDPMMRKGKEDDEDDADSAQTVEAKQADEAAAAAVRQPASATDDCCTINTIVERALAQSMSLRVKLEIAASIVKLIQVFQSGDLCASQAALERFISLTSKPIGIQSNDIRHIAIDVIEMHQFASNYPDEMRQLEMSVQSTDEPSDLWSIFESSNSTGIQSNDDRHISSNVMGVYQPDDAPPQVHQPLMHEEECAMFVHAEDKLLPDLHDISDISPVLDWFDSRR